MNPDAFLSVLARLLQQLRGKKGSIQKRERTTIGAVVGAWFADYQPAFLSMVGDPGALAPMDEYLQAALKLSADGKTKRATVTRCIRDGHQHFIDHLLVPLNRAYWARAPQKTPAGRDAVVVARLKALDADLADSYEQVVVDIEDGDRWSYRGPAGELREVLTGVLHRLAPNADVEVTDWYKEARRSGTRKEPTPIRAERVKYILRARVTGDTATETAEKFMTSVEERLASVVNATYKQGAAATHAGTEQSEVVQLVQYVNALLRELLPEA
jgi:hypothetical protein